MRHGGIWGAGPAGSCTHLCLLSTPLLPRGEALRGALGSLGAKIQARYGVSSPKWLWPYLLTSHGGHYQPTSCTPQLVFGGLRLKLQGLRSPGMAPGMGP